MKGFNRENQLLSLCGLNCGLCPMNIDNHCPGCGGGAGNQSCRIARCSLEHGKIEYCYNCKEYPCKNYDHIDDFDSFITHKRQKNDLERAKQIGIASYNAEQKEKIEILNMLLSDFNDGRRKTFFCVSVNLLELAEIKKIIEQILSNKDIDNLTIKDKSSYVTQLFQNAATGKNIELKLRKKK